MGDGVQFEFLDRAILGLVYCGAGMKDIAAELDISQSTLYAHVQLICKMAQVERRQLNVWIQQHPEAMVWNSTSLPGLHVQPCNCDYCVLSPRRLVKVSGHAAEGEGG